MIKQIQVYVPMCPNMCPNSTVVVSNDIQISVSDSVWLPVKSSIWDSIRRSVKQTLFQRG